MWFKKQDPSKVLKEMADLMTMIEKRISSLEIEVDSLRVRMRKKLFATENTDQEPEKSRIDDGFDELRRLNKAGTS